MKDIAMLDKMYELNKTYFKELSMYILAGKKKLQEVREKDLNDWWRRQNAVVFRKMLRRPRIWTASATASRKSCNDLELTPYDFSSDSTADPSGSGK